MKKKLALKMNEHNNGYMAMGRYAVWTSDVNENDKPDLNEAFFVKRERAPDDPLRLSGRRFVGPNLWPDEADLPGFRAHVLEYVRDDGRSGAAVSAGGCGGARSRTDWFDAAFTDSQFSFRLSHYPPVEAEANQFGIAPHTDSNFMTFLAQTEVPGLQVRMPSGNWSDVPYIPGSFAVNSGDIAEALEQRPVQIDPAPGIAAGRPSSLCDPVLSGPPLRSADRVPADLHRSRQSAAMAADHLCRMAGLVVRRQLRSKRAKRRSVDTAPSSALDLKACKCISPCRPSTRHPGEGGRVQGIRRRTLRTGFPPRAGRSGAGLAAARLLRRSAPRNDTVMSLRAQRGNPAGHKPVGRRKIVRAIPEHL